MPWAKGFCFVHDDSWLTQMSVVIIILIGVLAVEHGRWLRLNILHRKITGFNPLTTKQIEMRYISFGCSDYHTSSMQIVSSNQFSLRQVLLTFPDEWDMTKVMTRQWRDFTAYNLPPHMFRTTRCAMLHHQILWWCWAMSNVVNLYTFID